MIGVILVNLDKKNPQRRGADRISAHIANIKVPPSFQKNLLSLQLRSLSNNLVIVILRTCQSTGQSLYLHLLVKVRQMMLKRARIRRRWTSSGRESRKKSSQVVLKEERRALEDEVLKELKEEVSKNVISGYSFSEADNDVVNKLVNKMTKSKGLEVAAVDKKNVVIDCPSTEVASDVAHS